MPHTVRPIYARPLTELDAACAHLALSWQANAASHAEYLALAIKCLAEKEHNPAVADEARHLAHFLHRSSREDEPEHARFTSTLAAHIAALREAMADALVHHPQQLAPSVSQTSFAHPARTCLALLSLAGVDLNPLAAQLVWFGFEVKVFANLHELAAASESIDAIVVQARFDAVDLPVLSALKGLIQQQFSKLPLVLMTPSLRFAPMLSAVRIGARACLSWPVDIADLVDALSAHGGRGEVFSPRVILVEKAGRVAEGIVSVLDQAGMVVRHITDAALLIDTAIAMKPDVILIDAVLEACDGPELARIVRFNSSLSALPILLLSSDRNQVISIGEGGAQAIDGALLKPLAPRALLAAVRARAARYRQQRQLHATDPLTGLGDYSAFRVALESEGIWAAREDAALTLVIVELDRLREINQTYGYACGDRALQANSRFLQAHLRRPDLLARVGGRRFALALSGETLSESMLVMHELREAFARIAHRAGGSELFYLDWTIGYAAWRRGESTEDWLGRAEHSLARARQAHSEQAAVQAINTEAAADGALPQDEE